MQSSSWFTLLLLCAAFQKHTNTMTRADKLAVLRQRAIDNATGVLRLSPC
jgi:hypothetical protein